MEGSRVLRLSLAVAAFVAIVPTGVRGQSSALFSDAENVVPSAFGHLSFTLSRGSIFEKFEGTAEALLDLFTVVTSRVDHAEEDAQLEAYFIQQIQGSVADIKSACREMCSLTFGEDTDIAERSSLGLDPYRGVMHFGVSVANSVDVVEFMRKSASEELRTDSLIFLGHLQPELHNTKDDIVKLNNTETLENAVAENRLFEVYYEFATVLRKVLTEAREFYNALGMLHQGTISPLLINFTTLTETYGRFQDMADEKGLQAAVSHSLMLLRHAAYWVEDGVLQLAVPVPLIGEDAGLFRAYRLKDAPLFKMRGERQQTFNSQHRFIAVSPDRASYYALTQEDWDNCLRMTGVRFCSELGSRLQSFDATCIGAVFADSPAQEDPCWWRTVEAGSIEAVAILDKVFGKRLVEEL